MVAIMRPRNEIKHTTSDIHSLVELINSVEGESRIVMEHTGRYYEVLAHQLSEANLFVSTINPKSRILIMIPFLKSNLIKWMPLRLHAMHLTNGKNLKQYSVMDELRNQLKTMNCHT